MIFNKRAIDIEITDNFVPHFLLQSFGILQKKIVFQLTAKTNERHTEHYSTCDREKRYGTCRNLISKFAKQKNNFIELSPCLIQFKFYLPYKFGCAFGAKSEYFAIISINLYHIRSAINNFTTDNKRSTLTYQMLKFHVRLFSMTNQMK